MSSMRVVSSLLAFVKATLGESECRGGLLALGHTTGTMAESFRILQLMKRTALRTEQEMWLVAGSNSCQKVPSSLRMARSWVSDKALFKTNVSIR